MVRKITWLLLITTTCQGGVVSRPLLVEWKGSRSTACQGLIEAFLKELRGLAGDRRIQLDTASAENRLQRGEPPLARRLVVSCDAGATGLSVESGGESLTLNYLAKAAGFDAADWVPFQERFLRPESPAEAREPVLAPPSLQQSPLSMPPSPPAINAAAASVEKSEAAAPASTHPIYRQWWFLALAAAAAGTATLLLVHPFQRDPSTINVEIH